MKTLIVIPTYNERENIGDLVERITALKETFNVLVIDDNSPDGTANIIRQLEKKSDRIHLISRASKEGLGSAYVVGFRFGISNGFEHIVTMDADFSHDPSMLESMVKASLQWDVVIGSRYTHGGRVENWPWVRRQLSYTANQLARCLLGRDVHDWTSGYRCYHRHVLEKLPLEGIHSNGYSFLVEILATCRRLGYRIAEIPITFTDRRFGRSKLSRLEIYKGVLTLLRLAMQKAFRAIASGDAR